MSAKIYRPARTAMQQGNRNTQHWVLEFDQQIPRKIDSVFGYTSSSDMLQQVKLRFPTQHEAEDYACRHGLAYRVIKPKEAKRKVVSYSENFSGNRSQPWTH